MVSQASQDFVLSVIDYQQEFVIKIILLFILLISFIAMFYYSFKLIPNVNDTFSYPLSTILFTYVLRLLPLVFVPLFPLYFVVFTYRTIALEIMMRYLFVSYGIAFALFGIFGMIFGFERLLRIFGLPYIATKNLRRVRRK
jgi:hypothetical protein